MASPSQPTNEPVSADSVRIGDQLSGFRPSRALATATVASLGVLAALFLWGSDAGRLERWFVPVVGPAVTFLPHASTAIVPTSVAEWVELVALAWVLTLGARTARRCWRSPDARAGILLRAGLRATLAVTVTLIVFYASWGLAYRREPLEVRLGWPTRPGEIDLRAADLEDLSVTLVGRVNALYLELHGWPDGFAPTTAPHGLPAADRAIDVGWERAAAALGLEPQAMRSRGPTKPLLSSGLFTVLGLGGFYFPFTGEANVNVWAPEWQLPHTMAHEKAHQRFVAPENEANFMGFLACISAPDPFVQYSGWLFAQRQALRALGRADPGAFDDVVVTRLPGVQRDIDFSRAFWDRYESPVSDVSDAINDAYLKANRVEGGIMSYSRSLELYVAWLRVGHPGGRPAP